MLHLCTGDPLADNIGTMDMNTDLMNELTTNASIMTVSLSPSLFDFGSVSDNDCTNDDQLLLQTDEILPDLSALEDFMDLTEFFGVSSAVGLMFSQSKCN